MKPVAETHHLQKRGSIWHYYRRVPLPLVPVIGKASIKQSLGVSDLKQAKVLRNALNVKVDVQFAAAEQALASPGQTGDVVPVSLVTLTEHLRSHIEQIDRRSAQRLLSDPPDSQEQRSEMRMDAEITAQILRNRDDPRASEWVLNTSNAVLAEANAPLVSERRSRSSRRPCAGGCWNWPLAGSTAWTTPTIAPPRPAVRSPARAKRHLRGTGGHVLDGAPPVL